MSCHICGKEAVDRCYSCGGLFCTEHGSVNCTRCETGIEPGTRADRVSATRLRDQPGRHAWWRALPAEDYEPPSCHICQGLARRVCSNCERHYCAEHAGPARLCRQCGRSSLLGLVCFLGAMVVMGGLLVGGQVVEHFGQERVTAFLGQSIRLAMLAAAYLLMSVSFMKIFRKSGKPGWAGFVPVYNLKMLVEIAGKPLWWIVLMGIPLANLAPCLSLARRFGRSLEFGVGLSLLGIIFYPVLAFSDSTYQPEGDVPSRRLRGYPTWADRM